MSTGVRRTPAPVATGAAGRAELARFADALRPAVMGPRLARALDGRTSTCHVLDAKYEPGVRATVLYEYAAGWVRGDLVPDGEVPTGRAGAPAAVVAPGLLLSVFPDDPDLPSLARVMDPAYLGPALAAALPDTPHRGVRCRTTPIRYRPGRRVTLRVELRRPGRRLRREGLPRPPQGGCRRRGGARPRGPRRRVRHAPDPRDGRAPARGRAGGPGGRGRRAPRRAAGPVARHVRRGRRRDGGDGARRAGPRRAAPDARRHRAGPVGRRRGRAVRAPGGGRRRRRPPDGRRLRAARGAAPDHPAGPAPCRPGHRARGLQTEPDAARPPAGAAAGPGPPGAVGPGCGRGHLPGLAPAAPAAATGPGPSRPAPVLATLRSAFLASYLETRGDRTLLARIAWQEAVALERKALRAWARAPGSPVADVLVREAETCLDGLTETP